MNISKECPKCGRDTTYNGWTNYETWNIKLWIDNEEDRYLYWQRKVENARERHCLEGDTRHMAAVDVARELETYHTSRVEEIGEAGFLNPSSPMSMVGWQYDILNAAVRSVNWYEIAKAWIEDYE